LPPRIAGEESSDADHLQPLTAILRKCSAIINMRLPDGKRLIKKPNHFQVRLKAPLRSFKRFVFNSTPLADDGEGRSNIT
jgi:hypothetical protein